MYPVTPKFPVFSHMMYQKNISQAHWKQLKILSTKRLVSLYSDVFWYSYITCKEF